MFISKLITLVITTYTISALCVAEPPREVEFRDSHHSHHSVHQELNNHLKSIHEEVAYQPGSSAGPEGLDLYGDGTDDLKSNSEISAGVALLKSIKTEPDENLLKSMAAPLPHYLPAERFKTTYGWRGGNAELYVGYKMMLIEHHEPLNTS